MYFPFFAQLEEGTPFARWSGQGKLSFPKDDDAADMYAEAVALLGLRVGEDGEVERLVGRIENQSVVISLNDSSKPVEIRYAWEDNPDVNLTGSHGLPTAPFRINLIS